MKKLSILFICILVNLNAAVYAQESLFGAAEIVSPEIHEDNSVTFRFLAPTADSVQLTGDFLPNVKKIMPFGEMEVPSTVNLAKSEKGVWTFTTGKLPSELYTYSFIVDGLKAIDPNNPFLIRDVANITNILIIGGGKADLYRTMDVPHGTVSKTWYDSPGLQMDRRLSIYTPPGYESSQEKYPVLYLLHGAGGDEEAWMELGRTAQILDNLIAQGKARPMLVVMPNGNVSQDAAPGLGSDGYYKPVFMAPQTMNGVYEANFMDIVKFVEGHYRVKTDKENRAIAGLSMGGFHSYHISRFYPNTFDYIGLFSAALMPREDASGKVYSQIDEGLKTQMENGYKLYWIGIGKTDFLYKANEEYRKKLDAWAMPYEYVETEGGHIWRNWRTYLSQFVPKLF
ncbi:MAG: alpha/beta hydrolase-fold protein [Saprospiraceae bacterium]